ncbi:MAG TPA: hypothetical protein VL463_08150 [Kofleriaceae bacterium]|nr:hypothetical protein [Kofleriaceae bacterium]
MVERNFECPRCHAKAIVRVPAVGANAQARESDADRALRIAACPICYERPAHVVAFAALRIGVIALAAAVATWMIGATMMGMRYDALAQLWALMPIVLIGVAGWLGSATLRRWRATSAIELVRRLGVAPERTLPKAIAVRPQVDGRRTTDDGRR